MIVCPVVLLTTLSVGCRSLSSLGGVNVKKAMPTKISLDARMVRDSNTAELVICHFDDTKGGPFAKPKEKAKRCTAELVALCEQLGIVVGQMQGTVRRSEPDDLLRLCRFHYENFLHRLYALQERCWDILTSISGEKRERGTRPDELRAVVRDSVQTTHPKLYKAFNNLYSLSKGDRKFRNTATHQTILYLGIQFPGKGTGIYEADSVLYWYDPKSKAGIATKKVVTKATRQFVAHHIKRIQGIVRAALLFADECHSVIDVKTWKE